ncbi:retrovirus-related pol polyprotein from transposon TNT 1-94 [Tanacetum coccineum]
MLDLIINQHEGINYDKTYALVTRLKAIRIFSVFSNYMNFIVYQMDVKSAFLNGKLKEEVYVKQPLSFESSEFPNHVCKSDKALMDLNKLQEHEPFTRSPNMYKEYLAEFWYSPKALENYKVSFSVSTGGIYGEVRVNTFRNAIGAHCLPHSSKYVAPPSIDIVRP